MADGSYRLVAFAGFFILAFLAWVTGTRERINWKTAGGCTLLVWGLGGLIFWFPPSRTLLQWINDALVSALTASQKGTVFLFGPLAIGPGQALPDGTPSIGFVLAMQVLPAVIFFSALVSALYYLNIMPVIVRAFAKLFYRVMHLSGAESLSASANIFVGIESSFTVQPWLGKMTRSELLTLLTCMMATVASTVLAVYVIALIKLFPQIAGHLVSASVISIPCAVLVSKLSLPETETPETLGQVPEPEPSAEGQQANLMVALIQGGEQGLKMAVGIATLLIVVLGLEALVDLLLGLLPAMNGAALSVARILGWLTWPFVVLLGLQPEEWRMAAEILGSRFVETEVTAYFSLSAVQSATPPAFSERSFVTLTYALCGFVHLASLGIFIGGLATMMPNHRVRDLSLLGARALWTAFLATLLTGCVAGVCFFSADSL